MAAGNIARAAVRGMAAAVLRVVYRFQYYVVGREKVCTMTSMFWSKNYNISAQPCERGWWEYGGVTVC